MEEKASHVLFVTFHLQDGLLLQSLLEVISKGKTSPFSKSVLKVAHLFSSFTSFSIGNGEQASFWEDGRANDFDLKSIFLTAFWLSTD